MRCKTGLVAALVVALVSITANNVRGSDTPSEEALPVSEQDIVSSSPRFDPLVPEITDVEEPARISADGDIKPS